MIDLRGDHLIRSRGVQICPDDPDPPAAASTANDALVAFHTPAETIRLRTLANPLVESCQDRLLIQGD